MAQLTPALVQFHDVGSAAQAEVPVPQAWPVEFAGREGIPQNGAPIRIKFGLLEPRRRGCCAADRFQ